MQRPFLLFIIAFFLLQVACKKQESHSLKEKVEQRDFPSIFQAWYGINMPQEWPVNTNEERLEMAAQHDILWEEPISQLGEGVPLVLGLKWDNKYAGLAKSFDLASMERAKANKARLLELNPNMIHLFEIRWRDAPSTFLPKDNDWWLRDADGNIVKGWPGGWVPFYMLDYNNPDFQDNVARQAKIACETGIYDGVMLDWSGQLEIIKKVRAAIGKDKLIIVNIHDDIKEGELYKDYINGSFMELNPIDSFSIPVEEMVINNNEDRNRRKWDNIKKALIWFEKNLQEPQTNCLEVWGNRKDLQRMRATTTLGLVYSNGYQLYADPNPLKTPDHYHNWYEFWNFNLGKPISNVIEKPDGSAWRNFENGVVVYNHYGNGKVSIHFNQLMTRLSSKEEGRNFILNDRDGEIFY